MTACPHGMPTPASCIDCMDEGNIAPRPQRLWRPDPEWSHWITADYASTCPICTDEVRQGETIARAISPSGSFHWVHPACLP